MDRPSSHSFWLCPVGPSRADFRWDSWLLRVFSHSSVGRQSLVSAPVRLHSFHFCTWTSLIFWEVCTGAYVEIKIVTKEASHYLHSSLRFLLCLSLMGSSSISCCFNSYTFIEDLIPPGSVFLPWTFLSELSWGDSGLFFCTSFQVSLPPQNQS